MVKSCAVFACSNRANLVAKEKGIKFYRFPLNKAKRRAWIKALNRKDWQPTPYTYVCSTHFVDGWHSYDRDDINYVPTVFPYKEKPADKGRLERAIKRNITKTTKEEEDTKKAREAQMKRASVSLHSYTSTHHDPVFVPRAEGVPAAVPQFDDDIGVKFTSDQGCQCDPDPLMEENKRLREENEGLKRENQQLRFGVDKIRDDDRATRFYTGLPTFAIFMWLYRYIEPKASQMTFWNGRNTTQGDRKRPQRMSLSLMDQLLAVLMRLKVGLFVQDIADRFMISPTTFSNIFNTWIPLLYEELKVLNVFPSKELVQKNMPSCFKDFTNVRVILDCTEIFIQRSSSLVNQNLTFSNYKHHNTLKFLIGITPAGVISFVSEAWGGRISDRQIVINSGLLELLEPGDAVMADKGFIIRDLLEARQCTLNIPPFRNSKCTQFTVDEVITTQEIAKLRIHVERNIGRVKTYHIFDGIMPLSLAPVASKCFSVACWLTALDVPIGPKVQ